jgi:hypothetical protein
MGNGRMTDREILDQLEQWLEAEVKALAPEVGMYWIGRINHAMSALGYLQLLREQADE